MRYLSAAILGIFLLSASVWETDIEVAKKKAKQEHKFVLLNFSGSDWCGPCIRLHDEIFESSNFKNFADSNLVLINADFPRKKKNQLPAEQKSKNNSLADKYNPQGIFPYTVLLDESGKVLKTWEGFPNKTSTQFTAQIKAYCNARK